MRLAPPRIMHPVTGVHAWTYPAGETLRRFAPEIWEEKRPARPHARERVLPDGSGLLAINLGDEPVVLHDPRTQQRWALHGAFVCGPRTGSLLLETHRPQWLLATSFGPGFAPRFLGVPARELRNDVVPLAALESALSTQMLADLGTAATPLERLRALERILLARIARPPGLPIAVDQATRVLREAAPRLGVLQSDIGLGATRLNALFAHEVGLTPKQYARVQRFQRGYRRFAHHPPRAWATLALETGYCDQAHFIQEVREFSGVSPTALSGRATGCANHARD